MGAHPDRTYAMLAKPVSGACNLRCAYCYYAGKERLLQTGTSRMSDEVLAAYIRQSLTMHGRNATVEFAWHGGEPTLAGIDFYRKAVRLEEQYGQGRKIVNTLQTNATCLSDELCRFFKEHGFLIGVSIDGPEDCHNAYRRGADGAGSFADTMRGIELLKKHGVSFNTLTTVNRVNEEHAARVYGFLRELTDWMQFLPVVESEAAEYEGSAGQLFAEPPGIHGLKIRHPLTPFSVTPEGYGKFLCTVFDEWKKRDEGHKHVQIIDVTLGNLQGIPSSLCVHHPLCGHSGCVEANGDVYACDRYAFPAYRLGNLLETDLGILMERNRQFGMHKTYGLPETCLDCPWIRLCFGGCPKDRLQGDRNYLCDGLRIFFRHLTECV
ncbi:MAG: anaerobic sulfatase maturase [Lachnospiraceae bacterium]|nr:anaerobic sulfatase maturase [Lachnospiraceae bacterium]